MRGQGPVVYCLVPSRNAMGPFPVVRFLLKEAHPYYVYAFPIGFRAGWLLGGPFRANGSPGVVPVERAGGRGSRYFIFIFLRGAFWYSRPLWS